MRFPKEKRIRLKGNKLKELYKAVIERDGHCCVECGRHDGIELHHIIFKSQGGSDTEGNLTTLCRLHHAKKHGIKIIED